MSAAAVLRQQERSRQGIRIAAARYAALRATTGTHTETVDVFLRDGTPVTALITVTLVPDPT